MAMLGKGTGYFPDPVDLRDYTPDHPRIAKTLNTITMLSGGALPPSVDLRPWCPPIVDQAHINSCTANAAAGVIGFYENRAFGRNLIASRLFIYKVARNLLFTIADNGAYLRTTMQALAMFGAPPEEYWPYYAPLVDVEPSAFHYSFASNYRALTYYRCDPPRTTEDELLDRIKSHLHANLPLMFGFIVFPSSFQALYNGKIPFPSPGELPMDGHAMVAVGYDDNMEIDGVNQLTGAVTKTVGAFLIRNCWGITWGDAGYGYLPYQYVLSNLANDWWALLKEEWINTGNFSVSPNPL
jgi:C1A family cysteine protease